MSTFTFSTTEKNKPLLICKGFAYTIDKTTNDKLIENMNITQENDGIERVKRNIQNRRGKNDLPEIPHDKTFNLIPDKLTTTNETEQLLVDGTFKVTPSIFYQLYAVHVVYRNAVLPVVFALLPNKTQQTYRRFIDKLSEICPLWSP
ncbi:unnamed protein product [Rotaria socialis]|uniref:MULE transposase domain-containing protein n=1 Tax=Rotaria socialis TaxID=392032 RepID=A0A820Q1M0_9BILA|nr:unnamed protein product [Rotaria socialis]CAF4498711.1 unnamed protein product [Rotaria socialis]